MGSAIWGLLSLLRLTPAHMAPRTQSCHAGAQRFTFWSFFLKHFARRGSHDSLYPLLGFPVSPSHKGLLSSHTLKGSSCYELPSPPVLFERLAHRITQYSITGIGKLSINLQTVDIFSFSIYMVSAAITHSCHCGGKTFIDNMSMDENGCVSIKHYWQKQAMGWI